MGNTIYAEIQKKYGQDGANYVAFRHHERKQYKHIRQKINKLKEQATDQQQRALDVIIKQKRKLQKDFQLAKKDAEKQKHGSIKKAEMKSKRKVQDFSGFNDQWNRLDSIYKDVNSQYEAEKTTLEKKIRQEVMRKQNKSNLKAIKEFDDRSDKTRKKIEQQCISKYPEKATLEGADQIPENITWDKYCDVFYSIFDQTKFFEQAEVGRYKVRTGIAPAMKLLCC